jgi:hypothetical protein
MNKRFVHHATITRLTLGNHYKLAMDDTDARSFECQMMLADYDESRASMRGD